MAWDSPLTGGFDEAFGLPVQRSTSPYEISTIIDLIPHIEDLEIRNLQFVPLIVTPPPRQAERRLRALRIVAPPQPARDRYMPQFLSCFSSITSLSLDDLSSPVTDDMPAPAARPDVAYLRLTFRRTECCSDWLNLVCANLSTSFTSGLVLGGFPTHSHEDDPVSHAVDRLIRRCPNLGSLTCLSPLPPSLVSYPSPCTTLRELRLSYEMLYGVHGNATRLPDWSSLATAMRSPLVSAVTNLTLEIAVSVIRGAGDLEPDEILLQRNARRVWTLLNWAAFGEFVGRLQSLTMDVRCQMFKEVRRSMDLGLQQELQPWRGDQGMYRETLEQVIRRQVSLTPDQKLAVLVSFPMPAS
ncbi:hypothetical protein PsYK624_125090 [Phanerochaete sordida]|uniref:Uncharacterized protein n=1 Tax=Phanerochaete sordida TaxID=48140 RepID=A0A9P3GMR2_9APHY|nr:hypothetical protein PsYK624_125090 [Phanerochaete sordida]